MSPWLRRALALALALVGCEAPRPAPPIAPGAATASASTSASGSASASASTSASPAPTSPGALTPALFDGVDVCLRDTGGATNGCAQKHGLVPTKGAAPERWCELLPKARTALIEARKLLQKANPKLELLVVSSYRPPSYQQCLWLEDQCKPAVCGPRDANGKALPCKAYDLADAKYAHAFDHCPHVDMRAIDVCAYDKTAVPLDARGVIDLSLVDDCATSTDKSHVLAAGRFFHPCGCRHTGWTKDLRTASQRTKIFTRGGPDQQLAMAEALRKAGFVDDVSTEWWHFSFRGL